MARARGTQPLFGYDVPEGFAYESEFITLDEEAALVAAIAAVPFSPFEMRGVTARRRVAFFGRSYDAPDDTTTPPIPPFLLSLRERVAEWVRLPPEGFVMALINEYPAGAPIGWHRDAPQYDLVVGISLLAACRMTFRPYLPPRGRTSRATEPRRATHEIVLLPRSAYVLCGAARNAFEHHIPAVSAFRYSVTFRTVRA